MHDPDVIAVSPDLVHSLQSTPFEVQWNCLKRVTALSVALLTAEEGLPLQSLQSSPSVEVIV